MPGRAPDDPLEVTTTGLGAGSTTPNQTARCPGVELDPGHAAGGPALRADRDGGEVQQLGVAGDEDQIVRSSVTLGRADDACRRP